MKEYCRADPPYWKILPLMALCFLLSGFQVNAQDQTRDREDLWISPGAEIARYSITNFAYGGSMAMGYGRKAMIGLKGAFFIDASGVVSTVELSFLLRWYFIGIASCSGPYFQASGGPALFTKGEDLSVPSKWGSVTGGLGIGWRFLLARYWFIDAELRGGYPYIAGAGVSFGLHI